jgi:Ca2+-binding EF-hand superfamily protein
MSSRPIEEVMDENGLVKKSDLKEWLSTTGFSDYQITKAMEILPENEEKMNPLVGSFMMRYTFISTFKKIDKNNNGIIDIKELKEGFDIKNDEVLEKLLKFFDLNNDKEISLEEYLKQVSDDSKDDEFIKIISKDAKKMKKL